MASPAPDSNCGILDHEDVKIKLQRATDLIDNVTDLYREHFEYSIDCWCFDDLSDRYRTISDKMRALDDAAMDLGEAVYYNLDGSQGCSCCSRKEYRKQFGSLVRLLIRRQRHFEDEIASTFEDYDTMENTTELRERVDQWIGELRPALRYSMKDLAREYAQHSAAVNPAVKLNALFDEMEALRVGKSPQTGKDQVSKDLYPGGTLDKKSRTFNLNDLQKMVKFAEVLLKQHEKISEQKLEASEQIQGRRERAQQASRAQKAQLAKERKELEDQKALWKGQLENERRQLDDAKKATAGEIARLTASNSELQKEAQHSKREESRSKKLLKKRDERIDSLIQDTAKKDAAASSLRKTLSERDKQLEEIRAEDAKRVYWRGEQEQQARVFGSVAAAWLGLVAWTWPRQPR